MGAALAFPVAAVTAAALTPAAIALARRTGFYDRPAGYKAHAAPTPYLGGIAVVAALLLAAALFGRGAVPSRRSPSAPWRFGCWAPLDDRLRARAAHPSRGRGRRRGRPLLRRRRLVDLLRRRRQPRPHYRLHDRRDQRLQPDGQHGRRLRHRLPPSPAPCSAPPPPPAAIPPWRRSASPSPAPAPASCASTSPRRRGSSSATAAACRSASSSRRSS